jgi:CubicO group peptidase (beta-lactamase class C family)
MNRPLEPIRFVACSIVLLLAGSASRPAAPASSRDAIDRYVEAEMAKQHIPGLALGIYRNGGIVLAKGYGLANVELHVPVTPATVFQSGSVGKQFTATAIMMLVEEGKIGLDDSLPKYFPDAPPTWQQITIRNLLTHTSGLKDYTDDDQTRSGGSFDLRADYTEEQEVHIIETFPLDFQPGEKWAYSNTNYLLLGAVIRKVTGAFYGDFLAARIFKPLGMTGTRVINEADIIPNRSAGYRLVKGVLKNQEWVSPTINTTADGSLYFNVLDLAKWDAALYGERLLPRSSLDQMWTIAALKDGGPNSGSYGFGWRIHAVNGHRLIEHGGAWQGFTTHIARYVDDRLTVVVLTNLDAADPTEIAHMVAGLYLPVLAHRPPA